MAILDIESTGINPRQDRIVELAIIKLHPDGRRETRVQRFNPEMPIPPEVAAIHGIRDEDVVSCPTFKAVAADLFRFLHGCDLAGYNIIRFDLPMLIEEFERASLHLNLDGVRVVDAQRIFHKREPRDLKAALAFYCNELHLGAHGAEADALATLRVLEGQMQRYSDLPRDVEGLDRYCSLRDKSWADREGRLKWVNGEVTINFGRKKGEFVRTLAKEDPGFLKWMLRGDFPSDTKDMVRQILEGRTPHPISAALSDQLSGAEPE